MQIALKDLVAPMGISKTCDHRAPQRCLWCDYLLLLQVDSNYFQQGRQCHPALVCRVTIFATKYVYHTNKVSTFAERNLTDFYVDIFV